MKFWKIPIFVFTVIPFYIFVLFASLIEPPWRIQDFLDNYRDWFNE